MYLTFIAIMFADNITVTCTYPCLFKLTSFDDTMHLVGNLLLYPCNWPHYGLWINLHFFMICMYKHCFLSLSLVSVMKCVKMYCYLPHNPLLLASFTCSSVHVTTLQSSPIGCPATSSVLCWCLLCFFILFSFCRLLSYCMEGKQNNHRKKRNRHQHNTDDGGQAVGEEMRHVQMRQAYRWRK